MTRGILYLMIHGPAFAERLAVSLFTLRQHYRGPATILTDDAACPLAARIAADTQADIRTIEPFTGSKHAAYVTKTRMPVWSPYDDTLFLDADTIITGPLDDLFGHPVTLTQFSTWISTGRKVSGRILWLKGKSPFVDRLIGAQLSKPHPAVNTGVMAWQRDKATEWLSLWNRISEANAGTFILDEVVAQCLSHLPEVRILSDRYNASPMYSEQGPAVKVWHFHGDKHWRKGQGRALWEPALRATLAANIGGIREWFGKHEKTTRGLTAGQFLD